MNVTFFNVTVQNNVFFCKYVGSTPYVAGERNEKRPVVFVGAMDAFNDWTTQWASWGK